MPNVIRLNERSTDCAYLEGDKALDRIHELKSRPTDIRFGTAGWGGDNSLNLSVGQNLDVNALKGRRVMAKAKSNRSSAADV